MKISGKYILPAMLVAGFLYSFFYDAINYKVNADDSFYNAMIDSYGCAGSIGICYKIANGRWFSHIICAMSFSFLRYDFSRYVYYLSLLLLIFFFGLTLLYRNYFKTFRKESISISRALRMALVLTSVIYFLLLKGRWETWTWISSVNTHLMSAALSFFLFALLMKEGTQLWRSIFVFILALCIGGLNEVNAICVALVCALLLIIRRYIPQWKGRRLNFMLCILAIGISLLINISSGGYKLRIEGLPDFEIGQALKNTVHTFLLPALQLKYIAFILASLLSFILFFARSHSLQKFGRVQWSMFAVALSIAAFNFFLHCYTLSDIVPARGELWIYCFLFFLLSVHLMRKPVAA